MELLGSRIYDRLIAAWLSVQINQQMIKRIGKFGNFFRTAYTPRLYIVEIYEMWKNIYNKYCKQKEVRRSGTRLKSKNHENNIYN